MIVMLVLKSAVLPGALTFLVSFGMGFFPDAVISPLRRFLLPATFLVGHFFLNGWPVWPPTGSTSSLIYIALAGGLWPFFETLTGRYSRTFLYFFLAAVVVLVLQPLVFNQWPFGDGAIQVAGMTLFSGFLWWLFDRGPSRFHWASLAVIPLVVGTGLSILTLTSGSALVAQMIGTYCALHGGLVASSLLNRGGYHYRDFSGFSVLMLSGFVLVSRYFVEVEDFRLALILSPLLLFLIYPLAPFRPKASFGEMVGLSILSVVPIGFALYEPFIEFLKNPY